jgi:hypothetical protein
MENEGNCKHSSFKYEEIFLPKADKILKVAIIRCIDCDTAIGAFLPQEVDHLYLGIGIKRIENSIAEFKSLTQISKTDKCNS